MYGFEAQASKPSSNGFDTQSTPSRLSLVLTNKPVNPHACLVRCERDSSMSTCVRPPPRLMPLRSFLTWLTSSLAPHVGACLASTKCHDAIVLLLDLVDAVSITHVLLLFTCPVPSQPYLVYPSSWPLSPSLLTRPLPLLVHRAWTSHLIFSIAAAMIFLPHPKERDPMENKSAES
jgi:hypothetical protein